MNNQVQSLFAMLSYGPQLEYLPQSEAISIHLSPTF